MYDEVINERLKNKLILLYVKRKNILFYFITRDSVNKNNDDLRNIHL